jgi:Protein of unknown function (DUF4241)
MKNIEKIIFMAAFFSLFSCFNKKSETEFNLYNKINSVQDYTNKNVKQKIDKEETEFNYSDFEDLKNNKFYERFFAGNLKITSGKIVCTDPIYREVGFPQNWEVAPGEYPVNLYIGLEDDFKGRIAYAEINFKNEIPAYWELSLIDESLLDDFEKKMNGMYPVENGLGCFTDFETYKVYSQEFDNYLNSNKKGNYYLDILEPHFKENSNNPEISRGEDWINYKPTKSNANIIMFGSGYGDGLYPRYVGFDKNGKVVKLITDFIQIETNVKE